MRKVTVLLIAILKFMPALTQSVGIGTTNPNSSAALDITDNTKGLLIPRMTTTAINAIANPAKGLMVYDTLLNQLTVNMGTAASPDWQTIVAKSGWGVNGNSGTNPFINFLGTTDRAPLVFKVNNARAAYIDTGGNYTYNTSFGYKALGKNSNGNLNTANGFYSLFSNTTGYQNTANGFYSLESNTSGSYNTAIGNEALNSNTSGTSNTAIGLSSLHANTYGNYNTSVGSASMIRTTGSQYNTAIGYYAGSSYDLGYNNTILGANCDAAFAGAYNDIAIGQGVTCTDNSQARIGNSSTYSIGGYANWSNISDGRYKKNLKEDVQGLGFIMKLRPVTYNLDITALSQKLNESRGKQMNTAMTTAMAEKEKVTQTGFVAQEVEQAANETGYNFSGVDKPRTDSGFYGLRYAEFVVPLVKAVQEQQTIIEAMNKRMDALEEQNKLLQQLLNKKN